jgi:hypothetical protein
MVVSPKAEKNIGYTFDKTKTSIHYQLHYTKKIAICKWFETKNHKILLLEK